MTLIEPGTPAGLLRCWPCQGRPSVGRPYCLSPIFSCTPNLLFDTRINEINTAIKIYMNSLEILVALSYFVSLSFHPLHTIIP